jgi:GTP-binding protein
MSDLLRQTRFLLSETDARKLNAAHAEVAFIGRSNVGKSSFLNALCQHRVLAKVSKTPGRTRMINVFEVGHFRWLVDLPGYGFAAGPVASKAGWAQMVEDYLTSRKTLRGIFLLIDRKVGPTRLDHQMREWLNAHGLPHIIVANKIDQVKPSQRFVQQRKIAQALGLTVSHIQWISATEWIGMDAMRLAVGQLLELA